MFHGMTPVFRRCLIRPVSTRRPVRASASGAGRQPRTGIERHQQIVSPRLVGQSDEFLQGSAHATRGLKKRSIRKAIPFDRVYFHYGIVARKRYPREGRFERIGNYTIADLRPPVPSLARIPGGLSRCEWMAERAGPAAWMQDRGRPELPAATPAAMPARGDRASRREAGFFCLTSWRAWRSRPWGLPSHRPRIPCSKGRRFVPPRRS
jgi:hypothetical protein